MKICVIAGTPTDTVLGVKFFENKGYEVVHSKALASTPKEQTLLQYDDRMLLHDMVVDIGFEAVEKGAEKLMIYCNSIATALNLQRLAKDLPLEFKTPLEEYESMAKSNDYLILLAANAQSLAGIERQMLQVNNDLKLVTLGILPLVNAIEKGMDPQEVLKETHLVRSIKSLEKVKDDGMKPQGVVLGCTHFPYVEKELEKEISLPILKPF